MTDYPDNPREPHYEPQTELESLLTEAHDEAMNKLAEAGVNVTGLVMVLHWKVEDADHPSGTEGTFVGFPDDPKSCMDIIWNAFQQGMASFGYEVRQVDTPGPDFSQN